MSIQFSLKTFSKYIFSIVATIAIVSSVVYAVNITNTTQTATPGDILTSSWVNDVNNKINTTLSGGTYARFDCPSGSCVLRNSSKVSSITRIGAGDYQINFSTPKATANYAAVAVCGADVVTGFLASVVYEYSTNYVRVGCRCWGNVACDAHYISVILSE